MLVRAVEAPEHVRQVLRVGAHVEVVVRQARGPFDVGRTRTPLETSERLTRPVVQRERLAPGSAAAWLDVPKPEVAPDLAARLTRNIPDSDAGDYYRTVLDLIVPALRTDMTRVVTCMLGSESHALALPEIGIRETRHELSHHGGNAEPLGRLTRADAFLTGQLAYFLDQLRGCEDRGEPLLDRTMILFGSGMSYGHSHGTANLPTILTGGRGLGLRHGRHVDFNLPAIARYDLGDANS
ncbi:MAG: DUF1552 domain-containing protein [bacterium]|nr:DUF1552 domain-containing protein [bacterium]